MDNTAQGADERFWDSDWETKDLKAATQDPKSFGEALRSKLFVLREAAMRTSTKFARENSYGTGNPEISRQARIQLLRIAIDAANLLLIFDEDDFKDIAPFEAGWPVVLAATRERANDWERAEAKIKRLRAGTNHHTRLLRYPETEIANFLGWWTWVAMPDLRLRTPTIEELQTLTKRILAALAEGYGEEWQDHPSIVALFGNDLRWKAWGRAQKRDFVRDKIEGHSRTVQERLKRIR